MTEGENKAIEYLKEEIKSLEKAKIEFSNEIEDKGWLQKNINELDNDIFYKNTLLNLIEKLQKENEDLTEVNHEQGQCYCQAKVEIENLREKRDKYYLLISKIRERLQKEYDLYNSKEQLKYSQDIIDVLQELLQEG